MKAVSTWSYTPYKAPLMYHGDIYICRIVPGETSIRFEWLKIEGAKNYKIFYREKSHTVKCLKIIQ